MIFPSSPTLTYNTAGWGEACFAKRQCSCFGSLRNNGGATMNDDKVAVPDEIAAHVHDLTMFKGGNTKVIFNLLDEGAYCVDRSRRIVHWNSAAERITGYRAEEVVGTHCYQKLLQHVDADGRDLCSCNEFCPLYLTMQDGGAREVHVSLLHKDGRRVPVKAKTVPLTDTDGEYIGAIELFHEAGVVENLREQVEFLTRKAHIDCLTGLPNRHSIGTHLQQCMDEWERYGWSFACFLADIDHFKQINDNFGHDAGDLAISTVMNTMAMAGRCSDFLGRMGGDEAVGILKDVDEQDLAAQLHRLNVMVQKARVAGPPFDLSVSVSIGATVVRTGDTPQGILKRTDEALYFSKKNGRNRYTII